MEVCLAGDVLGGPAEVRGKGEGEHGRHGWYHDIRGHDRHGPNGAHAAGAGERASEVAAVAGRVLGGVHGKVRDGCALCGRTVVSSPGCGRSLLLGGRFLSAENARC